MRLPGHRSWQLETQTLYLLRGQALQAYEGRHAYMSDKAGMTPTQGLHRISLLVTFSTLLWQSFSSISG